MLSEAKRGSLTLSGEKPGTLGVRDPWCDLKRSVAQNKTHGYHVAQNKTHGYHIDFELCDRSRD